MVNFIAHILLSGENEEILVGNYIADLIKQSDVVSLRPDIEKGVMLHRMIDSYTDEHPVNRNVLDFLYARHRKYAPVLLDIYYDYFLIKYWNLYSTISFKEKCQRTYCVLCKHIEKIPKSALGNVENLLEKRWLEVAYKDFKGLERTFYFLRKRTSRPDYILGATRSLIDLNPELEHAFLSFFPDLHTRCEDWLER